jgi:hypothetical protein
MHTFVCRQGALALECDHIGTRLLLRHPGRHLLLHIDHLGAELLVHALDYIRLCRDGTATLGAQARRSGVHRGGRKGRCRCG